MKIICGQCGAIYGRKVHANRTRPAYWQCNTRCKSGLGACKAENISEDTIDRVFVEAWNTVVQKQNSFSLRWEKQKKEGSELEQVRAEQMQALANEGSIREVIPELVQNVLECIVVIGEGVFEVHFLDGTRLAVSL